MWLFCKHGFFSAVRHNAKPDTVLLRARVAGDLERLAAAHGVALDVAHTPDADYAYRAELPLKTWAEIARREAADIDYGNFKSAVHDGTARDDAYLDIWSILCALQDSTRPTVR